MRNSLLILGFLLIFCSLSHAQTDLIAHRSHSGKNMNFSPLGRDNAGWVMPPEMVERMDSIAKVDSLKQDSLQKLHESTAEIPEARHDSVRKALQELQGTKEAKPLQDE